MIKLSSVKRGQHNTRSLVIGRLFVCMGLCLVSLYSTISTAWFNAYFRTIISIGTTDDFEEIVVTDNKKEITIKKKAARTPDGKDDSDKLVATDNKKEISIKKEATRTPDSKVFFHFLSHIPKSGTSYAFEAIHKLLWPLPEWQALPKGKHFRGCNEATQPTALFRSR
jgi:hypothetical protein